MGNLKDRLIYALGGYTEEDRIGSQALIDRAVEENDRLRKELSKAKEELEKTRKKLQARRREGLSKMCPNVVVQDFEFVDLKLKAELPCNLTEKRKEYEKERVADSILKEAKKYVQIDQERDGGTTYTRARLWVGAPIYDNDFCSYGERRINDGEI